MRLIVSLAAFLLLAVLAVYGQFVYERFKAKEWRRAAGHGTAAVVLSCVVFLLGWYGFTAQTAASARTVPKLEILDKRDLEEEVSLRKQRNQLSIQNLDNALQLIRVKFDEAEYAFGKSDPDRALQLYTEIERGADQNGSFGTFPSACIKNNMAVAYFRKQGDRGFKTSTLLFDALRVEPKPQHDLDIIQRNIDALDKYVNQ